MTIDGRKIGRIVHGYVTKSGGILPKSANDDYAIYQRKCNELLNAPSEKHSATDTVACFPLIKAMAIEGNPKAQYTMVTYHRCDKKKNKKVRNWLYKAAIGGVVEAQSELGDLYYFGNTKSNEEKCNKVRRNYKKAFKWRLAAAENGNVTAQSDIAYMYSKGEGIRRSWRKSVYWDKKAARAGNGISQHNLSIAYAKGRGVKRNYVEALYWAEKAASQGINGAAKFVRNLKSPIGDP